MNACPGTEQTFAGAPGAATLCAQPNTGIAMTKGSSSDCAGELLSLDSREFGRITLCIRQAAEGAGAAGLLAGVDGCAGGRETFSNSSGVKLSLCYTVPATARAEGYKALSAGLEGVIVSPQEPARPKQEPLKPKTVADCAARGPSFIRDRNDPSNCIRCDRGMVANAAHTACVTVNVQKTQPPPKGEVARPKSQAPVLELPGVGGGSNIPGGFSTRGTGGGKP